MPLPFSLSQRPSLPSLSWALGSNTSPTPEKDAGEKTPKSAPPRTSHSSVGSHLRRLSGSRSIKHTSIVVSRPTTPANPSPLSAGFGLPVEDDDPFGVLALQKAGLHIKEAGTNNRPGSDAFQYRPAPSSPIWRSSMASAMSRASRPSMDGRSSIMTGRRSVAHSRQGSTSTVNTLNTLSQPFDLDALEKNSLRSMSPVRELGHSRKASPEGKAKRSPDSDRKPLVSKPEPLLLGDGEFKRRDDNPSPLSKLEVVDEDAQEDVRKEEAKRKTRSTEYDFESDLDRLARELREMADEHEEEERRSQESDAKRLDSVADAETVAGVEDDNEDVKTPQRLSAHSSEDAALGPKVIEAVAIAQPREPTAKHPSYSDKMADDRDDSIADDVDEDDEDEDEDEYDFDDDEEPVIIEQAVQTQVPVNLRPRHMAMASLQARAQIVSVHLPPPPKVPSRNPRRARQVEENDLSIQDQYDDYMQHPSPSSSHDDDSNSSFSLSRDSFDDGQDIMTQTSQGSDAGSTEVTPTREKGFETISGRLERSLEEYEPQRLSRDEFDLTEHKPTALGATGSTEAGHDNASVTSNDKGHATESHRTDRSQIKSGLLSAPVPDVPERRRPFSFEVGVSEENLNQKSLDDVIHAKGQPVVEKTPASRSELKETAGEPIMIPKLSADDTSIYEEDFS